MPTSPDDEQSPGIFHLQEDFELITSDETFVRLTGEEGYSLVLIQTTGDVTDENVQAIQNFVDQT